MTKLPNPRSARLLMNEDVEREQENALYRPRSDDDEPDLPKGYRHIRRAIQALLVLGRPLPGQEQE